MNSVRDVCSLQFSFDELEEFFSSLCFCFALCSCSIFLSTGFEMCVRFRYFLTNEKKSSSAFILLLFLFHFPLNSVRDVCSLTFSFNE